MVFYCQKPLNYNVNSICLHDIKSWYAQKRQVGSSKTLGLEEFQVIEEDASESEAFDVQVAGASTHEVALQLLFFGPEEDHQSATEPLQVRGEGKRVKKSLLPVQLPRLLPFKKRKQILL